MGTATVASSFKRIATWAEQHLPELVTSLNPPASEDAIANFDKAIGSKLPKDVKDLYRLHDGQSLDGPGLFYGLPFLPLENALSDWRSWSQIAREQDEDDTYGGYTSSPANAIALQYANAGWVPLCDDYGGNHIGIDLAPGPAGVRGQVINFGRDEEEKVVIAPSLGDFLLWFAAQLERGNFRIDRSDKEHIEFDIDRPHGAPFIDSVRTLFGSA